MDDVQRWPSVKKSYEAFLKLNPSKEIVEKKTSHTHEPEKEDVSNRKKLSNSVKREKVYEISQKPWKVFHRELKNADVETLTVDDANWIRKNIGQARRTIIPTLPNEQLDVHDSLNSIKIETNKKENFLILNDKATNFIMFSTI